MRIIWFSLVSVLAVGGAFALAACHRKAAPDAPVVRGVIVEIQPERHSLIVKHEDIPGVMPAMTMAFRVDDATLARVRNGQAITAHFAERDGVYWLDDVTAAATPPAGKSP